MQDLLRQFRYEETSQERLDKFLVGCLPELTRSRIQGLIKDERVSVNGEVVTKTGFNVEKGNVVEVNLPEPESAGLMPEAIPLTVVYENDQLIVIDKPAGMVVHPSVGHKGGTLVNAALAHAPDMEGMDTEGRPGVVHRLDKDTSGLILFAKTIEALNALQAQFKSRKVRKTYIALSDGHPKTAVGRIEAAIGRNPSLRKQMAIISDPKRARAATSEYKVIESFPEHSLFEVHPETGRTHQIRLHLAFIGCPIVGDKVYGRKKPSLPLGRHFLHAAKLEILLPGESQPSTFESPLPEDLQNVLDELRK
jgi:23S rRNA pseudouridine1911/1915/1917 synthase